MKHWLETMSGRKFDLLSDDPDFDLADLAWGCARQGRYSGQWRPEVRWYSVAEHSMHVAAAAGRLPSPLPEYHDRTRFVRTALCHDLAEGILGDVATPLKALLPEYREIEERLNRALARRYDLIYPLPPEIKQLDLRILVDETQALLSARDRMDWGILNGVEPLGVRLNCWTPRTAYARFTSSLHDFGVR